MSDQPSNFRKNARKVSNVILLVNAIGSLIAIIAVIALIVWLNSMA